ncbi:MAG TPA: DUF4388 domain-containing protein [Thermoanaerobaculia bacterium]
MSLSGLFSTMAMPDLIQWARTAQRTGSLTLQDAGGTTIRVFFRNGRIVFTATSERRQAYSRHLLYRGLCTQEEIDAALAVQRDTGVMMAAVLVRNGTLSAADAERTLTRKTFDDLCEIFLWREGKFIFDPNAARPQGFLAIDVDPIEVVMEGVRRSDHWVRLTATMHAGSFFESNGEPWPVRAPWEDEEMARIVRPLLDGSTNLTDLVGALPFSSYAIWQAVSELLEKRLIHAADTTSAFDRESRVASKLAEAERNVSGGRYVEAMEILQGLSSAFPHRRDILQKLLEVADLFRAAVYEQNFTHEDVPVPTVNQEALAHLKLDPTDGFILSRIDGTLTVREILRITPVAETATLRSLKRLLQSKVIDFPNRKRPDAASAALAARRAVV